LIGNIIADPGFVEQFGTQRNSNGDIALASKVLVAWNTIGSCGQILGMVTLPFLTAALGRKISMYYYWAIPALSVAIECFARSWQVWLIAKLFGGIGVGCLQSTIPGYISEVAPPRSRGAFLMCYSLWWITGQFFAPVSLQTLSKKAPNDFLTPMYTQWAQIGLMMIIYLLIPESPASCAVRGKVEEAKSPSVFFTKTLQILMLSTPINC
jgi:MFS family permease